MLPLARPSARTIVPLLSHFLGGSVTSRHLRKSDLSPASGICVSGSSVRTRKSLINPVHRLSDISVSFKGNLGLVSACERGRVVWTS
jgi:hypothetical protein